MISVTYTKGKDRVTVKVPVLRSFDMMWPSCYDLYDKGYVVELDGRLRVVASLGSNVTKLMTDEDLGDYFLDLNKAWFGLRSITEFIKSEEETPDE